jgi:hypothetical protein
MIPYHALGLIRGDSSDGTAAAGRARVDMIEGHGEISEKALQDRSAGRIVDMEPNLRRSGWARYVALGGRHGRK